MNRPDQVSTVIDVGGGAQLRDLRILKELGIQLGVGVDIQKAADTEARRLGIEYIRADIDRDGLPIADSVADAVLMNNVIEHMY